VPGSIPRRLRTPRPGDQLTAVEGPDSLFPSLWRVSRLGEVATHLPIGDGIASSASGRVWPGSPKVLFGLGESKEQEMERKGRAFPGPPWEPMGPPWALVPETPEGD
jgi:hypothetical protein